MGRVKNPLLDKRVKKVSVFDTETAPYYEQVEIYEKKGRTQPKYDVIGEPWKVKDMWHWNTDKRKREVIFDIGWTVADERGQILIRRNYLVREIFTNMDLMKHAFYFSKYPHYLDMLNEGVIHLKPWTEIICLWESDIMQYGIQEVYAFNIAFDKRAMHDTHRILTGRNLNFWEAQGLYTNCLWGMACETILQKKSFIKLAIEKGWLTPAGRISTNAETCYRYITEIWDFEESHTALDDAIIETKIMAACWASHTKMSLGILSQPFRLVHAKALALGLMEDPNGASED